MQGPQTIQVLLEHGADTDALDDRGRTPLDWLGRAAKSVDRDAVRDVLGRGPIPLAWTGAFTIVGLPLSG
jgi:ankyrin repeat protein